MEGYEDRIPYFRVMAIMASLIFSIIGCGPSKQEAKRKEVEKQQQDKDKREIMEIAKKYNATYFPPENLGTSRYTYQIQAFFNININQPILFKGYLEDIEESDGGLYIEFFCPLGESYFIDKKAVRFRLAISEKSVQQFFGGKRQEPEAGSWDYILRRKSSSSFSYLFFEPDYFVLAKIDKISSSRIYSFSGTAHGEEVEIEPDVTKNLIATGTFIDAIAIPKEKK